MDQRASSRNAWAVLNGLRQPKGGLVGTMGADTNASNREEGTRTKQTTNISNILLQPAKWQGWDKWRIPMGASSDVLLIKLHTIILNLCARSDTKM